MHGVQKKDRALETRVILLALLFVADRLLKNFIWFSVPKGTDYLLLHPILNSSISFSAPLPGLIEEILAPVLLLVTFALILYSVTLFIARKPLFFWWGLIAIGALSNVMDRYQLGGVLDFIDLRFFPVFNMSDVYISCGAVVIILLELHRSRRQLYARTHQ